MIFFLILRLMKKNFNLPRCKVLPKASRGTPLSHLENSMTSLFVKVVAVDLGFFLY